jgi:putative phage-type endonuclease
MAVFLGNFESGSDEWLELRKGNAVVTGTLAGAIAGLNPWKSAFTAWAEATERISDEVKQSRAMRLGQLLENPIIQLWLEENPGYEIETGVGTFAHDDNDWARANPDGLLIYPDKSKGIIEIKTSRMPFDVIPPHYEAQVLWYMWVMGVKKGKLVALFSGNDLQTFDVEWNDFKFQSIFASVVRWRDCVLSDSKPEWDGSDSTYQTARDLSPREYSDEPVDLGDLGIHLGNAQSEADEAYKKLQMLKSITLDNLGSATRGIVNVDGNEYVVCTRSVNKNGIVSLTVKKGKNA